MSPHIKIFKMAAPPSCKSHTVKSLEFSFSDFSGKIMTYRQDYDVITREFPAKNWGNPRNCDFWLISSCNVHSDNQTQCNDTVLLKTSFKYRFQPLVPPLPHLLAPPLLPHPLAPVPQPLPQQFGSPLPKVNRQLKIVNYFTYTQHFFCRW